MALVWYLIMISLQTASTRVNQMETVCRAIEKLLWNQRNRPQL
jgi:hypothetical protein